MCVPTSPPEHLSCSGGFSLHTHFRAHRALRELVSSMKGPTVRTQKKSNETAQQSRNVAELLVDTVVWFRNRGHGCPTAIQMAATVLGLNPRKARSVWYDEPFVSTEEEYRTARAAFLDHLVERRRELSQRLLRLEEQERRWRLDNAAGMGALPSVAFQSAPENG